MPGERKCPGQQSPPTPRHTRTPSLPQRRAGHQKLKKYSFTVMPRGSALADLGLLRRPWSASETFLKKNKQTNKVFLFLKKSAFCKKECLNVRQKLGTRNSCKTCKTCTLSFTHSGHAEQLLFSCLCSKVTLPLSHSFNLDMLNRASVVTNRIEKKHI